MQKISIKNMGPIKEFTSELLKMNLLIGEQATGKSTICKSVYFCRTIRDELVDYLYYIAVMGVSGSEQQRPGSFALIDVSDPEKQILNVLNQNLKKKFKQIFGFDSSSNSAMEMHYDYGADISMGITIEESSGDIAFQYSEKLATALKNLEREFVGTLHHQELTDFSFAGAERRRIHREIKNRVNAIFDDSLSTYYIPAGRQLLALLSAQKTQIDYSSVDFINRKFMQFIESLQNVKKCDYLCAVDSEKCVHLIELKGTKINDAFLQLESTPAAIRQYSSHQTLLDGLNRLDAYIVSPLRQQVPNNLNEKKRRLCKKLLKFCSVKPDKSMDLLKLVKVDPSCKGFVERDGQIQCSNQYPLEM